MAIIPPTTTGPTMVLSTTGHTVMPGTMSAGGKPTHRCPEQPEYLTALPRTKATSFHGVATHASDAQVLDLVGTTLASRQYMLDIPTVAPSAITIPSPPASRKSTCLENDDRSNRAAGVSILPSEPPHCQTRRIPSSDQHRPGNDRTALYLNQISAIITVATWGLLKEMNLQRTASAAFWTMLAALLLAALAFTVIL